MKLKELILEAKSPKILPVKQIVKKIKSDKSAAKEFESIVRESNIRGQIGLSIYSDGTVGCETMSYGKFIAASEQDAEEIINELNDYNKTLEKKITNHFVSVFLEIYNVKFSDKDLININGKKLITKINKASKDYFDKTGGFNSSDVKEYTNKIKNFIEEEFRKIKDGKGFSRYRDEIIYALENIKNVKVSVDDFKNPNYSVNNSSVKIHLDKKIISVDLSRKF